MDTNCQNCGATLSFEFLEDRLTCAYCGTTHVPTLRDELGIALAPGIESQHSCPTCEKVLAHGKVSDWRLLVCRECRGLLVSRKNLLKIILYARAQSNVSDRKPRAIEPESLVRVLDCPSCQVPMLAHPYYGPGDFVIDSCADCDQIWLDGGELDKSSTIRWSGSVWS